jgi:hypothetical protein
LHITDPDDIKGIDSSLKKTFQQIKDEAVHVDEPDWMKRHNNKKSSQHNVVSARVPIVFDPSKN